MEFEHSDKVKPLQEKLRRFMDEHVYPNEQRYFDEVEENSGRAALEAEQIVEELKPKARAAGLWNLFLPEARTAAGSPTSSTRRCARSWGASLLGAGGVQLLGARHRQHGNADACTAPRSRRSSGSSRCSRAKIRSCFAMTEPAVASSDATNIAAPHRARRRPLRHQRPQVVDVRRHRPALQDLHLHGQDRSGRAARTSSSR